MSYSYLILNPINTGASLNITLVGDAKLAHGIVEGDYTLNSTPVNEKQNWIHIQGSSAIWYDKEFKNWKIGDREVLGSSICFLKSTKNTKRPDEATTWKYANDDEEWMPTSNIFGSLGMY